MTKPGRPLWLVTLADLALLLVGFFVFIQANQSMDRAELTEAIRAGFGMDEPVEPAMAVGMGRVDGFAPGSALVPDAAAALAWAREAAHDPRTTIRVTGMADGSIADVDPRTGSGAILAADRATATAALLLRARIVTPDRIQISTTAGRRRAVELNLGYDGAHR